MSGYHILGHGGGGRHGGGHGHGEGFGPGPWPWGYPAGYALQVPLIWDDGEDIDETATRLVAPQSDVDALAEAVARKLAGHMVGGPPDNYLGLWQWDKTYLPGDSVLFYDGAKQSYFVAIAKTNGDEPASSGNWIRSMNVVATSTMGESIVDDINIFDTSDYDNGDKLAIQANQIFNSLGRPSQFEAPMEAMWAAYEKARMGWLGQTSSTLKHYYGTQMKQVGADAAALVAGMQKAYPSKVAVAPTLASSVYVPKVDEPYAFLGIPGWGWVIIGIGATGIIGFGLYKILSVAAPVATKFAMERYMPARV